VVWKTQFWPKMDKKHEIFFKNLQKKQNPRQKK